MLIAFIVLLACLFGCALYAGPVFVRLARQLARTGSAVDGLVRLIEDRFLPRAENLVGRTSLAVRELEEVSARFQELGQRAEEAIAPLGDVTVAVDAALRPFVQTAGEVGLTRTRFRAWSVGARTVWSAWRRLREFR